MCIAYFCKWYFLLAEVRKKQKIFSHTLLGPNEIRVLEGGAGYIEHISVVAWQSLTGIAHPPSPLFSVVSREKIAALV